MSNKSINLALISVSDKRGLIAFARALVALDIALLSTGGTAKALSDAGIPVQDVSDYTGFPEMMGGRVKTLHPKIHGGILGRRGKDDAVMAQHDITAIDLVVVNLYPFAQTIAKPDCQLDLAIENIDIGGPAMLRSAAKNFESVAVVVEPDDYDKIIAELKRDTDQSQLSLDTRFALSAKAFAHTAQYDGAIANYLGGINAQGEAQAFSNSFNQQFVLRQSLRYGENPHQAAAFYVEQPVPACSVASAAQLQGKALSYNNIADTDAALECVKQFTAAPSCVIVKHANPCGVATSETVLQAYDLAFSTDPESAFGGIIAFNTVLDAATAKAIVARQFVEVIIAPQIEPAALKVFAAKPNIRLLQVEGRQDAVHPQLDAKRVHGGLLVQHADIALHDTLKVVTKRAPSEQEMEDLLFCWKVAKFVKSNAIIYAKNQMTIGVGAGQMSRINSARIAAIKAQHANLEVQGAVMASDAFFPFRDGLDNAAQVGISAVIQPGGSMRDDEVIAAADEHNIAMVFTAMRHFRH